MSCTMKDFQLSEMEKVAKVLLKYKLSDDDLEVVTDALKYAYYEWCEANAHLCLFEDVMKQLSDDDVYHNFTKMMLPLALGYIPQKMEETFAFYEDD